MKLKEGFSGNAGKLSPLYNKKNLPVYEKILFFKMPLFEYTACSEDPLIYTDSDDIQYQLDRHFETDGGSIPSIAQAVPFLKLNPFDFLRSYLYHDCAFIYGGLYIKYKHETDFKFRLLNRVTSNSILKMMMPYDGASWIDTSIIYNFVKAGSVFVWDNKKDAIQKQNRKNSNIKIYDKNGDPIEE